MPKRTQNSVTARWFGRFAAFTALATLGLIGMGGLVTSHGVGMAVPDWPTTYGYNMFLFPISLWKGGIFYEHSHRLYASGVGLLTTILAVWAWFQQPAHCSRRRLRVLGTIAFLGVVFQGVLGGLRVTLYKDEIGIFHAAIAQLFLVLLAGMAFYASPWWRKLGEIQSRPVWAAARHLLLAASLAVFFQLAIGAIMRHQHAGLAVPDFPLAYGQIWPSTDQASLDQINRSRLDAREFKPITSFHMVLHMVHRLTALLILLGVLAIAWRLRKQAGRASAVSRLAFGWFAAIIAQASLGAWTVWSNKAADVTTLHVVLGALCLVYGSCLTLAAYALARREAQPALFGAKAQPLPA